MRFNKKVFVIVDAYTTGRFLAPYLNANGYSCIHIQSRNSVIPVYLATFSRENFINNLIFNGDLNVLLENLKPYQIKGVIPGAETGVMLADQLSEALNLETSNGTKVSLARRDKYEMVNQLTKFNVPNAKSYKTANLNEMLAWLDQHKTLPVVIKPLASSGTFGVKVCHNSQEMVQAFQNIINEGNVFNEINSEVLIQQFLKGQEYIVNTVSYAGTHQTVDLWRKYKSLSSGTPINDYSELVNINEAVYTVLSSYIGKVLDALEIKYGAAHSEVMMTSDGPILIETAARLSGSIDPSAIIEAIGDNQVARLIKSYISPSEFLKNQFVQEQKKHARHVFFTSPIDGIAKNSPNFKPIIDLPSFHSISFRFEKGDTLVKTTSLADFPGFIYLVADTEDQLNKDYKAFRQLEQMLYADMLK
jgi:biotin carboxylase